MSTTSRSGSYQVVARRFRPATFAEVVGQDSILHSLRSALGEARIPHAFLFSGSRGVGKTTLARILARCLNCEAGPTPDPCGECAPCRAILDGSSVDVVEIDAASHNRVDDIRELRSKVGFSTMGGRYKVYILDEAHMITPQGWNAFLKTLEEPPPGVVFVMATTELHRVPETIRSRCQVLHFRRVSEADIRRRLRMIVDAEGVPVADEVLAEIAAQSRGGMRDAETALERILPVAREKGTAFDLAMYRDLFLRVGGEAVREVVAALLAGEAAPALRFAAELAAAGVDERQALGEVLDLLRALLLIKIDGPETALLESRGPERQAQVELAERAEVERLEAMIQAGLLGRDRLRRLEDRLLIFELTLLRMASAGSLPLLGELVAAMGSGTAPAEPDRGAAAAPARAGGGHPGSTGNLKDRLLQRLQQERPMLAQTVEPCELAGPDDGDVVTFKLRGGRRMLRDRLSSPGVQQDLAAALGDLLGRPVKVAVELADAAGAAGSPPAPAPRRATGKSPPGEAARRVLERFDGRIVDPEDGAKN